MFYLKQALDTLTIKHLYSVYGIHCMSTDVSAYNFENLFKIWFLINTFIVSFGNFALFLTFPANPILLETID